MLRTHSILCFFLAISLAVGCGDDSSDSNSVAAGGTAAAGPANPGTPGAPPAGFTWPAQTKDAVDTYAKVVSANYLDALRAAGALKGALEALVAAPSDQTLLAAKNAWLASRVPYLQTEVFRFYQGPIDNDETGPEGAINAWPLDENYIDYTTDEPNAGIINDPSKSIDDMLRDLNEVGGEANVATGYHAIEFLLWGQDTDPMGAGKRPFTDYVESADGPGQNAKRRGEYLLKVADMLVQDLGGVHGAWQPGQPYVTSFLSDEKAAFRNILAGMIILSGFETGSERLKPALDKGDQEEEHSCFSDNTHVDMIEDVRGIHNVWNGTYKATDGTVTSGVSIKAIVAEANAELANRIDAEINNSLALAEALPVPFDQAILAGNTAGNKAVSDLIEALNAQTKSLREVVTLFGLSAVNDPE